MIRCFILLLYACTIFGIGYDAGGGDRTSCGRPYRAGRLYQPPCDLNRHGFCTKAGQLYPWQAVKRFIKDNQGLMKRMYGDQRHGHVLRAELDDPDEFQEENWKPTPVRFAKYQHHEDIANELNEDFDDIDFEEEPRYFRDRDLTNDDVLKTKFVISEQEAAVAIKLAELKAAAHFRRPSSHRSQYTTQKTTSTTQKSTTTTTTTEKNEVTANIEDEPITKSSTEGTEEAALTVAATTTDYSTTEPSTTTDRTSATTASSIVFTQKTTIASSTAEASKENDELGENSDTNIDQAAESSEDSEVYSDGEHLKQIGNTPAMLFQDMEGDNNKKKGPLNYNKMKGVNACPVKEEVVAPFWANNTRGEVLALLNMYPFEQYVHWEKCTFEHRQMYCREGCRCEQQYRLHRLLAYDPNNECRGIFSDWFRFPSCCVCKCYDIPPEFRVTSRSPRYEKSYIEEEEYNINNF